MKCIYLFILFITIVAAITARRHRSRRSHDDKLVEAQIKEFSDLGPFDEQKIHDRLEGFITKLRKSAPTCVSFFKTAQHNIDNLFKKLKSRKNEVGGVAFKNKEKEAKSIYEPFFNSSVECWKKVRAEKIAEKKKASS